MKVENLKSLLDMKVENLKSLLDMVEKRAGTSRQEAKNSSDRAQGLTTLLSEIWKIRQDAKKEEVLGLLDATQLACRKVMYVVMNKERNSPVIEQWKERVGALHTPKEEVDGVLRQVAEDAVKVRELLNQLQRVYELSETVRVAVQCAEEMITALRARGDRHALRPKDFPKRDEANDLPSRVSGVAAELLKKELKLQEVTDRLNQLETTAREHSQLLRLPEINDLIMRSKKDASVTSSHVSGRFASLLKAWLAEAWVEKGFQPNRVRVEINNLCGRLSKSGEPLYTILMEINSTMTNPDRKPAIDGKTKKAVSLGIMLIEFIDEHKAQQKGSKDPQLDLMQRKAKADLREILKKKREEFKDVGAKDRDIDALLDALNGRPGKGEK
jgi:hypothetical protein